MAETDRHDRLKQEPFSWHAGGGRVFIYWGGRLVRTLKAEKAASLLRQMEGADAFEQQLVLARFTGNFKHGNEKKA